MRFYMIVLLGLLLLLTGCADKLAEGDRKREASVQKAKLDATPESQVEIGHEGVKIFRGLTFYNEPYRFIEMQNEINGWLKQQSGKIEIIQRNLSAANSTGIVCIHYKRLK